MRFIYWGAGGALAVSLLGYSIWLGTAMGLAVAIMLTPSGSNKRVIVEDVTTGKIEIQPNDRATRRYIQGRGE